MRPEPKPETRCSLRCHRHHSDGRCGEAAVVLRTDALFLLHATTAVIERHVPVPLLMSATLFGSGDGALLLLVRGEHDVVLRGPCALLPHSWPRIGFAASITSDVEDADTDAVPCDLRLLHEAIADTARLVDHRISATVKDADSLDINTCNLRKAVDFLPIKDKVELRKRGMRGAAVAGAVTLASWDQLVPKPPAPVEPHAIPPSLRGVLDAHEVVMCGAITQFGAAGATGARADPTRRFLAITPSLVLLCEAAVGRILGRFFIASLHSILLFVDVWPPVRMELRLIGGAESRSIDFSLCDANGRDDPREEVPQTTVRSVAIVADVIMKLASRHGVGVRCIHQRVGAPAPPDESPSPRAPGASVNEQVKRPLSTRSSVVGTPAAGEHAAADVTPAASPAAPGSPRRLFTQDSFFAALPQFSPKASLVRQGSSRGRSLSSSSSADADAEAHDNEQSASPSPQQLQRSTSLLREAALAPVHTIRDFMRPPPDAAAVFGATCRAAIGGSGSGGNEGADLISLVRHARRFTSRGSWVVRAIVLHEGALHVAERTGLLRRTVLWHRIHAIHILNNPPVPTLCIFVRDEPNLVLRGLEGNDATPHAAGGGRGGGGGGGGGDQTARQHPLLDVASVLRHSPLCEAKVTVAAEPESLTPNWLTASSPSEPHAATRSITRRSSSRALRRRSSGGGSSSRGGLAAAAASPGVIDRDEEGDGDGTGPHEVEGDGNGATPSSTAGTPVVLPPELASLPPLSAIADLRAVTDKRLLALLNLTPGQPQLRDIVFARRVQRLSTKERWLDRVLVVRRPVRFPKNAHLFLLDDAGKVHRAIPLGSLCRLIISEGRRCVSLFVASEPSCIVRAMPKGAYDIAELVSVLVFACDVGCHVQREETRQLRPGEVTLLDRTQSLCHLSHSPTLNSSSMLALARAGSMSSAASFRETSPLAARRRSVHFSPTAPAHSPIPFDNGGAAFRSVASEIFHPGEDAAEDSSVPPTPGPPGAAAEGSGPPPQLERLESEESVGAGSAVGSLETRVAMLAVAETTRRLAIAKEHARLYKPSLTLFRRAIGRMALAHQESIARNAIGQSEAHAFAAIATAHHHWLASHSADCVAAAAVALAEIESAEAAAREDLAAQEAHLGDRIMTVVRDAHLFLDLGPPPRIDVTAVPHAALQLQEAAARRKLLLARAQLWLSTDQSFREQLVRVFDARSARKKKQQQQRQRQHFRAGGVALSFNDLLAGEEEGRRAVVETQSAVRTFALKSFWRELLLVATSAWLAELRRVLGVALDAHVAALDQAHRGLVTDVSLLALQRRVRKIEAKEAAARCSVAALEDEHFRDMAELARSAAHAAERTSFPLWVVPQLERAMQWRTACGLGHGGGGDDDAASGVAQRDSPGTTIAELLRAVRALEERLDATALPPTPTPAPTPTPPPPPPSADAAAVSPGSIATTSLQRRLQRREDHARYDLREQERLERDEAAARWGTCVAPEAAARRSLRDAFALSARRRAALQEIEDRLAAVEDAEATTRETLSAALLLALSEIVDPLRLACFVPPASAARTAAPCPPAPPSALPAVIAALVRDGEQAARGALEGECSRACADLQRSELRGRKHARRMALLRQAECEALRDYERRHVAPDEEAPLQPPASDAHANAASCGPDPALASRIRIRAGASSFALETSDARGVALLLRQHLPLSQPPRPSGPNGSGAAHTVISAAGAAWAACTIVSLRETFTGPAAVIGRALQQASESRALQPRALGRLGAAEDTWMDLSTSSVIAKLMDS